jgi:hypothetical protein
VVRGAAVQVKDLFDTSQDIPFQRTTARELLREFGIEPSAEFNISDPLNPAGLAAGSAVLATDILTDPLSLLTGVGQLGKGPKLAAQAQKSARLAKQIGIEGGRLEAPLSQLVGRRARGVIPAPTSAQIPGAAEQVNAFETLARHTTKKAPSVDEILSVRTGAKDISTPAPEFNLKEFLGGALEGLTPREINRLIDDLPRDVTAFGLPRQQVAALARQEADRAKDLLQRDTRSI